MKVIVITTDRKPGGLAVAFLNYVSCLLEAGYDVHAVMPNGAQMLDHYDKSIDITKLSTIDIKLFRFGFLPPSVRKIVMQSDVIISHNNFLCRGLMRTKCPVIAVCHSDKDKHLQLANHIIVLSQAVANDFVQKGLSVERISVLPHYYSPREINNQYQAKILKPFIVAAAGRMVDKKGFEDFINAAALVRLKCPDIEFWLAGTGEKEKSLRALAQKINAPVIFKGWMDIRDLAQSIHVFCLTSKREPFGYVLCEMMDYGLPCISTITNGPLEILDQGRAGLLYQSGDHVALAKEIIRLYSDGDLQKNFSDLSFSRVREPAFAKQTFISKLKKIITEHHMKANKNQYI